MMWRHIVKIGSRIKTGGSNQWPYWPVIPSWLRYRAPSQEEPANERLPVLWPMSRLHPVTMVHETSCLTSLRRDCCRKHRIKENQEYFFIVWQGLKSILACLAWSWWFSSGLWTESGSEADLISDPPRQPGYCIFMISHRDQWAWPSQPSHLGSVSPQTD